jgi:hypothetical protein
MRTPKRAAPLRGGAPAARRPPAQRRSRAGMFPVAAAHRALQRVSPRGRVGRDASLLLSGVMTYLARELLDTAADSGSPNYHRFNQQAEKACAGCDARHMARVSGANVGHVLRSDDDFQRLVGRGVIIPVEHARVHPPIQLALLAPAQRSRQQAAAAARATAQAAHTAAHAAAEAAAAAAEQEAAAAAEDDAADAAANAHLHDPALAAAAAANPW